MGDVNWLRPAIGLSTYNLSNLFQTLPGDSDLNSPRCLKAEAEQLILVEQRLQDAYVDQIDPKLDCILVILPSTHSPSRLIMQRKNSIIEWIFLAYKINMYIEMFMN